VLLLVQGATAQVCFEANAPTFIGTFFVDLLGADIDGDSDTDLVAVSGAATLSVLLNHGDGTFAPGAHYAGVGAGRLTGADLDADGDTDLAVTSNSVPGTVSVLLNPGNGTFGAHVQYGVGPLPTGITSADFDGDGDIDLAASNSESHTVSLLLNQGQGSFAPQVQYAAGPEPYSVTSADVDGDGDVDLAVAHRWDGTAAVLLNQGNGTYSAPMFHNVGSAWGSADVTTADLDDDGRADLVTLGGNSEVAVLVNQGGGAFAPRAKYPVGVAPARVVATDLDGDGDVDLAAVCLVPKSVSLLLNRGDGTFAPHQELGAGAHWRSMTHADFDGDGDRELAVQNVDGPIIAPTATVYRNCLEQGIGFCFGDGSLLTSCPCAFPDTVPTPAAATAHGCANSLNFRGARLVGVGEVAPAPGTLAFRAHIAPNYLGFAFLVKGDANATSGIAAGDGIRCVDGAIVRFGDHYAGTNGALIGNWTYPNSVQTTPVSIATAQVAGEIAYYQLLYRNATANFCNPATVNWSNGYRITWPP
jgi:hypothetical protein